MDNINYKMIFEYLCTSNKQSSNFPNKRNLIVYGTDFPDKFSKLFGKNYYRYGVNMYNNNQDNISIYSSILTLIDKEFISLSISEQQKKIKFFITFLLDKLPEVYEESQFKLLNISKETIKTNIENMDWLILQTLVSILKINILIFDFATEKKYIVYKNDYCDPWQPFIFLAKKEDNYEPIFGEKKCLFSINDNILKKNLKNNISYYKKDHLKKDYILVDNFSEIYEKMITKYTPELNKIDLKKNKKSKLIKMILEIDPSSIIKKTINKKELIDIYIDKYQTYPKQIAISI